MPAVMSREGPDQGAVLVPAADPEQLKGAWRAVIRAWCQAHKEEIREEERKRRGQTAGA